MQLIIVLAGIALTSMQALPLIIPGIGVMTAGFFGGHAIASGWVGQRAGKARALGASLYLLFYYLGASVLGSTGGFAWAHGGWHGVILYTTGLGLIALLVAVVLARFDRPSDKDLAAMDCQALTVSEMALEGEIAIRDGVFRQYLADDVGVAQKEKAAPSERGPSQS